MYSSIQAPAHQGTAHRPRAQKPASIPRLNGPGRAVLPSVAPTAPIQHRSGVLVRFKEGEQETHASILERLRHIGGLQGKAPVVFQINKRCNFGEAWGVCGSSEELGAWDPAKALPLQWTPGDRWYSVVHLPRDKEVEFKYVLLDVNKNNVFKGWANQAFGNNNIRLHVHAGNTVDMAGVATTRVYDESQVSVTGTRVAESTTISPSNIAGAPATTTNTTHTTVTTGPTTTHPHEPVTFPERARASVQPLVGQMSGAVGGVMSFDTLPARRSSDRPVMGSETRPSVPGGVIHMTGAMPDYDSADPANQLVMTPRQASAGEQAEEHTTHEHIVHDSLTTDRQLAADQGVAPHTVEPHTLSHLDQSSIDLGYRQHSPHPSYSDYTSGGMTTASPATGVPSSFGDVTAFTSTPEEAGADVGAFTLGTRHAAPTASEQAAHDAEHIRPEAAQMRPQEHPITGEEARTTTAAAAGLDMPVSAAQATAASILSNMGADEELPMAPLSSGVTPIDGASAAHGSGIIPGKNPLVMAASIVFNKVSEFVAPSTSTPEEHEAVLESNVSNAPPQPYSGWLSGAYARQEPATYTPPIAPETPTSEMEADVYAHPIDVTQKDDISSAPESGTVRQ